MLPVIANDFADREVCTNGQQLHRTLAKWLNMWYTIIIAVLRATAAILRATTAILSAIPAILSAIPAILRAIPAILRAIPAILRESGGIILASFTILVGSVKNPSIKLQFGPIHVPIPHFTHQLIGVILPAEKRTEITK
jgi:hypothetical protein